MKRFLHGLALLAFCLTLFIESDTFASSTIPMPIEEVYGESDAVLRGRVVGVTAYRAADGLIYTRTSLRVDEILKGICPAIIAVEHRGGQVGHEQEFFGLSPRLIPQREYLLFVRRNASGKLECTQGSASAFEFAPAEPHSPTETILKETRSLAATHPEAGSDVTDQTGTAMIQPQVTTGMLGNINSRFLQPDRGEPIPVLIDAASLPAGMTLQQTTNAVLQALNAWAEVTSLKFKIESISNFGQGADTISTPDEKLRIQLHDNYGRINSANVLGIGGRNGYSVPNSAGWDLGGNVAGNEFRRSTYGYVVLESGNVKMQNLATFAEVLCHEIGHALNMAHSSENPSEPNPTLREAAMYFRAHEDGRGASLGAYDVPTIQQVYPFNTVPHMPIPFPLHRVIDATSASVPVSLEGINEVEIRGLDLQSPDLTLVTVNPSASIGSIGSSGNKIIFNAPVGNYLDTARFDPRVEVGPSFSSYARIFVRLSDGTNASPYTMVRVISITRDGSGNLDGIPDYWMTHHFGHANPQAADLSRAGDDADGDKLTTLQEYLTAMSPQNASSAQQITSFAGGTLQFQAKGHELYEVLSSSNLTAWTHAGFVFPTNQSLAERTALPQVSITATVSNLPLTETHRFYRIRRVP